MLTCYFRHLKPIFDRAGITVTKENRKQIDQIIHAIVGVEYKNCPVTWKEVKSVLLKDEEGFVLKLKSGWSQK